MNKESLLKELQLREIPIDNNQLDALMRFM